MSDERFSFLYDFQVRDQQLATAAQHLTQFNAALERSRLALGAFERTAAAGGGQLHRNLQQSSSSAVDLAAKLAIVGTALRTVSQLAVGAFEQFSRFGDTAITAFGERAGTIRGYTQLLGSKPQAELEFYRAQQFAQKTDFTSEQVEKGQARLMAQGFRGQDLYSTLFSAADLAAIMPGDKNQTLERVIMAISQIKSKGKLQAEELTQQLAEAGLNTGQVFQQLLKPLGVKSVADVQKKLSAGEVTADIAIPAIQRAILAQLGTSRAGEYAAGSSGSLTGLISNRDEAFKNLLKSFDADENLPAMARYKAALKEQGSLFDLNARSGKNLSLVLQDASNASIGLKSSWTEFTSSLLESFGDSYVKRAAETGRDYFGDALRASDAMDRLGRSIGALGAVAADAVGNTNSLVGRLGGKGADVLDEEMARYRLLGEGRYGEFLYQSARGTPVGQLAGAGYRATGRFLGEHIYGYNYADELPDPGFEYRQRLKNLRKEILESGTDEGSAKGGGSSSSISDLLNPKLTHWGPGNTLKQATSSKKRSKSEAGWNTPIWHYEPSGGGSTVDAAAAINAMVETTGSSSAGSVYNQTFNITVPTHPGQSPAEIARAVHLELSTQLRQLSRSPRAGR